MHILIDSKPVAALTTKQQKSLALSRVEEAVTGTVLSSAEATDAFVRQTRRWFVILGGIAIVVMLAISVAGAVSDPIDGWSIAVGGPVMAGVLALFLRWMLRRRIRSWNRTLEHRGQGLPPAGTTIGIDAKGLTSGPEVFAWPSLAIAEVEMTSYNAPSGDTTTLVTVIERLSLAAGGRAVVLDRAMLRNGPQLVDNVWRHLCPAKA